MLVGVGSDASSSRHGSCSAPARCLGILPWSKSRHGAIGG